jgi:hypothetical protein
MNCQKCNTENDQETKFCKNCGANIQPKVEVPANTKTNSNLSDILLIIFIGVALITNTIIVVIQKIYPESYYPGSNRVIIGHYILGLTWVLQNLSFILIPLSLKNKLMKLLGIIFMSLIVLYWLYNNLKFMFDF